MTILLTVIVYDRTLYSKKIYANDGKELKTSLYDDMKQRG